MPRLGGDLSQNELAASGAYEKLRALPVYEARWPYQCRCGNYGWVLYRGRCYCPRCARRLDPLPRRDSLMDPCGVCGLGREADHRACIKIVAAEDAGRAGDA